MTRHLLTILDLSREEIEHLLTRARELKVFHKQGQNPTPLKGKTVAMIFDKPSTRTRVSFEAGIAQLGGASIYLAPGQVNLNGYDLLSYGADGKPGGTGEDADILSWQ